MLRAAALGALLLAGGCAVAPMGMPVPSFDNVARVRAANLPPLALGTFHLAAGKPASMDQRISIRSNTLHSPFGSSFSAYLKESLAADLRAAGVLDPAAALVISGQLTDSQVEVPADTATATVAARFVVSRGGAALFDKELRASASWPSSFIGVEAIPMALNRYQVLYRELGAMLVSDPEFQAAVRR